MGTIALIARLVVAFPRILELLQQINKSVNEEIKKQKDTDRYNANRALIDKWVRDYKADSDESAGVSDKTGGNGAI